MEKQQSDEAKISEYRILIESSICWQKKEDFLKIIGDFINGGLNADDFKQKYLSLEDEIGEKCDNYTFSIENDLINPETELEIYFPSKAADFSTIIFLTLDSLIRLYSPDITYGQSNHYRYSENELRRRVKNEILPILKDLQIWNSVDEIHLQLVEYQINYRTNSKLIDQLNWKNRDQYIELLEEYLKGSSSFLNFMEKYRSIVETAKKLETKSIKLTYHYQAEGFSNHILTLIQLFYSYQTGFEISSKIFEYWVRKILVEMKNHYG